MTINVIRTIVDDPQSSVWRSADFSGGRNSVHFWEVSSIVRVWSKEEQASNRDRFWSMLGSGVSVTAACENLGVNRRTGRTGRAFLCEPPWAFVSFRMPFTYFGTSVIVANMITAEDIARELGVTGKRLRDFLRDDKNGFSRSPAEKHQRWFFTPEEANEVKRKFREGARGGRVVRFVPKD